MDKILLQRRALLGGLVAVALFAHGVVVQQVLPFIPTTTLWSGLLKFILSGGVVYSGIVLVPLWLFDRVLWRLINPQYDMSGFWQIHLYELFPNDPKHIAAAGRKAVEPYRKELLDHEGHAMIRQTPFRMWVQEAAGKSASGVTTVWNAEVLTDRLPGAIYVVFESAGASGLSGRDALIATQRDERGRPTVLEGDAFHVLKHLDIVIRGRIRYCRSRTRPNNSMQRTALRAAADAGR